MTTTNQRAVEELARQHCDVTTDKNGRESFEFDNHGLIAFAESLRAPGWRPISEEQVEVAAIRMWNAMGPGPEWAHQTERTRNQYRTMARAALSTLPPPPGEG